MKTKSKIYLFLGALFFLSVFFAQIDSIGNVAKADSCSECRDSYANDNPESNCYDYCNSGGAFNDYDYNSCISDGGDVAYCSQFPGAPQNAQDLGNMSSGNCNFNSDCGSGFTCYQQSCVDDATYKENVSFFDRAGNTASQVFSSGGSVFSGNSNTAPAKSADQIAAEKRTSTEAMAAANSAAAARNNAVNNVNNANAQRSRCGTDAAACAAADAAIAKANAEYAAAQAVFDEKIAKANAAYANVNPNASSSGVGYMLCANGMLATVCETSGGGTPITTGLGVGIGGGYAGGSGLGNVSGLSGVTSLKCGDGFQDVGGVCFPMNTGLSSAPIYVILSNLFSWLMGLFTTFAVIAFVVSGIQYFMSTGNEDMAETAKDNAKAALVGIIVGLSGFIIIKAIAAALSGQGYFF